MAVPVAAKVAGVSAAVFLALLVVAARPEPFPFDEATLEWAQANGPRPGTAASAFWTSVMLFGDWAVSLVVFGLVAGGFLVRRRPGAALAVAVLAGVQPALVLALKAVVARPRPVGGAPTAFPSGHAATVVTLFILAWAVANVARTPTWAQGRRFAAFMTVAGALASFLVGFGRVITLHHWPSDVLGGWALGIAYGAAGVTWLSGPVAAATPTRGAPGQPGPGGRS